MTGRARLVIKQVNNGYIVTVLDEGKSIMDSLYVKPIMVFENMKDMFDYVESIFNNSEN